MLVTTTHTIQDRKIEYLGLVSGEAILTGGIFKDPRNIVSKAKGMAVDEMCGEAAKMGANAVIGVNLDFETVVLSSRDLLMVAASGTAVVLS